MGSICHHCKYRPSADDSDKTCPVDGHVLIDEAEHNKSEHDPYLGKIFAGKYKIVGILGSGGMGAVYRAIQEPVGREVAVKILHTRLSEVTSEARHRFLREAEIIGRLDHPGLVTLHDFGVEGNSTQFMVQQLVRGQTLREVFAAGNLGRSRFLEVILSVLEAVGAAHKMGMVHRDLKPENIMLGQTNYGEERVKVLDFGIAKILENSIWEEDKLTRTGMAFGTPLYMSPEQAMGMKVNYSTDLYAVGVILFEGLTGHVPYNAATPFSVLNMHCVKPIPALPPHVPTELANVVVRAMAKKAEDRYSSAEEMRQAILVAPESDFGHGPLDQTLPPEASDIQSGYTSELASGDTWQADSLRSCDIIVANTAAGAAPPSIATHVRSASLTNNPVGTSQQLLGEIGKAEPMWPVPWWHSKLTKGLVAAGAIALIFAAILQFTRGNGDKAEPLTPKLSHAEADLDHLGASASSDPNLAKIASAVAQPDAGMPADESDIGITVGAAQDRDDDGDIAERQKKSVTSGKPPRRRDRATKGPRSSDRASDPPPTAPRPSPKAQATPNDAAQQPPEPAKPPEGKSQDSASKSHWGEIW